MEVAGSAVDLDADVALIVGVAVSAVFSVLATIFAYLANRAAAKAQAVGQVAQFRQEWINELRNDLARFHAIGVTPDYAADADPEFYRIGTRIQLLMNPKDDDYAQLDQLLDKYLKASGAGRAEKYANDAAFVSVSQQILKREWERLKNDIKRRKI